MPQCQRCPKRCRNATPKLAQPSRHAVLVSLGLEWSLAGHSIMKRNTRQAQLDRPRTDQQSIQIYDDILYDRYLISLSTSSEAQLCLPGGRTSRRKQHPSIQVSNNTRTCNFMHITLLDMLSSASSSESLDCDCHGFATCCAFVSCGTCLGLVPYGHFGHGRCGQRCWQFDHGWQGRHLHHPPPGVEPTSWRVGTLVGMLWRCRQLGGRSCYGDQRE